MASYVDAIVSEEVVFDDFLQWISGCSASVLPDSIQRRLTCSRYEFALCFLNYLRENTSSILSSDCAKKTSAKVCQLASDQTTHQNISIEKSILKEQTLQQEANPINTKKNIPKLDAKLSKKTICSPDSSVTSVATDKKLHVHNNFRGKVHNTNKTRDSSHSVGNSPFDGIATAHLPNITFNNSKKDSPKQKQSPLENSTLKDCRSPDLSGEKYSNRSISREEWGVKNSQNTTLWDYLSKDNSLNAKKKNASEDVHNDERNQEKKCTSKLGSRQKRQRRINPTRVDRSVEGMKGQASITLLQPEPVSFGLPQGAPLPSSAFCSRSTEEDELNSSNFAEERALLKEERMKMQSHDHDSVTSSPPIASTCIARCARTEPQPSNVTHRKELDILANVFSILIDRNLVPNILSELCFLSNLLMVQVLDEFHPEESSNNTKEDVRKSYFDSVHNCTYFAVAVLEKQSHLLQLLDRNTRRIISENSRLARFSHTLPMQISKEEGAIRREAIISQIPSMPSALTSFQSDVDNRKNFPTDRTFRTFCRQRDEFCEALRTWEGGRSTPGWSFGVVLGPRVKAILSPGNVTPEPTNFVHLARFFRAQLIANCGYGGATGMEEPSSAGEVVPLALRDADPEKLQRLQRRLVWPSRARGGCCPLPTFPGAQEFFRDFIIFGANPIFNEHLKDGLISDILELNDSQFSASEFEDRDNKVDDDTRCDYIRCIVNLQLLAKFLGLLVFLPYQYEGRLPDNIVLSHCALRNKIMPVMDLLALTKSAHRLSRLSVTIPWMVVYLSMLDRVSSNLDYYRDLLFPTLVITYRQLASPHKCVEGSKIPLTHAMLLVRLCLGWLFEQPNFLQEAVFVDKTISLALHESLASDVSSNKMTDKPTGPDNLDLIDAFVVHTICPFLSELRLILMDSSSNRSGGASNIVRHITPVSAPDCLPTLSSSRVIELKLEENFFCNQPASVRRTVDFVSERIASSCVRHICNQLLPRALKHGLLRVHASVLEKIQKKNSDVPSSSSHLPSMENFEVIMAREIRELSAEEWLNLKKDCLQYADEECERRAWEALPPLLPNSTSKQARGESSESEEVVSQAVTEVCIQVTCRTARQRVRRWLTSHTSPALFAKEYEVEVAKTLATAEKSFETKNKSVDEGLVSSQDPVFQSHCEDATSPAQLIIKLRDLILDIKQATSVEMKRVLGLIDEITFSIQSRSDFTPPSLRSIFSLSVDLAVFLVAHDGVGGNSAQFLTRSGDWDKFIALWCKLSSNVEDAFTHLLGPRNLFLLSTKEQEQQHAVKKPSGSSSWPHRLSCLLSALLSSKQLTSKQLEEQSLIVLHYPWPQEFLERYSECLRGVLSHPMVANCSGEDDDNTSALLMEWLAESCATMEILE